jgi:hypothetical protein
MILQGKDAEDFVEKAEQNERMAKLPKLMSNREIPDSELNAEWDFSYQFLDTLDNMKKAHGILRIHNNWRQGAEIEPVDPKDLTVALEVALKAMDDTIGLCEEEWGGEWEMK